MAESTNGRKSQRLNIEIAPGVRVALNRYIEQVKASPDNTTVSLTYTNLINQALKEYLSKREQQIKEDHHGENHS